MPWHAGSGISRVAVECSSSSSSRCGRGHGDPPPSSILDSRAGPCAGRTAGAGGGRQVRQREVEEEGPPAARGGGGRRPGCARWWEEGAPAARSGGRTAAARGVAMAAVMLDLVHGVGDAGARFAGGLVGVGAVGGGRVGGALGAVGHGGAPGGGRWRWTAVGRSAAIDGMGRAGGCRRELEVGDEGIGSGLGGC